MCNFQQRLFGNLGQTVPIQLEFRRRDGQPVKNATVKVKGLGTEQLPLFNNKDSIYGEVIPSAMQLWTGLCCIIFHTLHAVVIVLREISSGRHATRYFPPHFYFPFLLLLSFHFTMREGGEGGQEQ